MRVPDRAAWAGALGVLAAVSAVAWSLAWPSAESPLSGCPPADLRAVDGGQGLLIEVCDPSASGLPPFPAAFALGLKLDLNRCSAAELASVPGIGPSLARAVVDARMRLAGERFKTWDDVDRVPGIGASKLELLQRYAVVRP